MKTTYELLKLKQKKPVSMRGSEEYKFFKKNKYLLDFLPRYTSLQKHDGEFFNIMRANIIIRSYLNKETFQREISILEDDYRKNARVNVETFYKSFRNRILDLPYFEVGQSRIYFPFFTIAINNLYYKGVDSLLVPPYSDLKHNYLPSIIDAFDTYGYQVYNSRFTRLVFIKANPTKKIAAFYHYDTNSIYFINDEGRLDNQIALMDKWISHPSLSHMLDRINPVIDAYFAMDKMGMVQALYENKLISEKMLNIIKKRKGKK